MKTTLRFGHMKWIHLASPSPAELEQLIEQYEFHELIAEDLQEMTVQHKIDQYDDVIFVVLNFPKYNPLTKKYMLNEFNIVLWKDYVITLSRYEANHVAKIVEQYREDLAESDTQDEEAFKISPYYILYTIIDAMYDKTIKSQSNASRDLVLLEQSLTGNTITKQAIEELMRKKANTAFFKYTFLPQKEILRELQSVCWWFYEWDLDVYFEDLESKLDKIINSTLILYETIQSLTDTHDAMLNLQTNSIIRILTIFTALTWILTFISGFYGMNISLPLMQNAYAWLYIILIMFATVFLMLYLFKRMRRI